MSTAPLARDPFAAAGGAIIVGERRWGIRPSGSTRWHDLARHVHEQHGGDRLLLLQVARRIESKHQEFAQEIGAATRPVRYVNGALGALPLGVVVVAAIVDAGYLARLAAGPDFMAVAVAALLTAVGAWWLRWAARPPFTLRPSMRRALRREAAFNRRLEAVLERAALYAAAGLEGKEALREAIRSDPEVPGAQLIVLLSHGAPEERAGMADTPLARCSHALARWLDDGAPAVDALVLSAARLRNEQGPAAALHPALAFPVLICLVPAAVLLALL